MTTLPIPGGTAELRDPALVSERHRRPLTRLQLQLASSPVGELLQAKDRMSDEDFATEVTKLIGTPAYRLLDDINDAAIVALVESWTFPCPVTLDGLLDLPGPAYDALKAETAKHVLKLLPTFTPTADPDSPTPPSAD